LDRHGDERPQLVNMYGITETTVHVTYRPITRDDLNAGSMIGRAIPDLQVYVLDETCVLFPMIFKARCTSVGLDSRAAT
jgi:non-ribosomal peptide synthetase component F